MQLINIAFKMKTKLIMFYEMFLNTYYYNQKNDEETSKRYAYVAVRNIIGVILFMFALVFFVVVTCVLNIHTNLRGNRLIAYSVMGVLVFSYLSFSKKKLKPMFDTIELGNVKPSKYFFLITLVLFGLFAGLMFAVARLLNYYLS